MKSQITDIEHLSKTKNIYDCELSFAGRGLKLNTKEDVKELYDEIMAKTDLKVLRLEGNTIAPAAAEELGKALKERKTLERFIGNDLFTGRLKDEIPLALRSICGSIDISGARLVEINMSDNAFGPIGLDALIEFFQSGCCHSLQELRLHNNGLGPQGAQKLAHSLEQGWRKSGEKMALKVFVCGRNRLEFEGAKSVSNTLGMIGTLEEIQMPQNGIRPNAIEFIAKACLSNPNLRTINMNDNTLRTIGAEWMAKSLSKLKHLEYINFGDCLTKSKGALVLTRALVQSPNIKEILLGFNEISLDAGIEIAGLIAQKMSKLELLDLNGNKFGEDGKMEIMGILKPIHSCVGTLSEDEGEGSDEEEESEGGQEEDSGDEEEDSEVVVDGDEDYDNLEDYEEYDEDEEEYDDEGEEDDDQYGNSDIVQAQESTLFKPFTTLTIKPSTPLATAAPNKSNLFTSMISNRFLKTNSVPEFDNFITTPDLDNLKALDDNSLKSVTELDQFDSKFIILFLNVLSKSYEASSKDLAIQRARALLEAFFKDADNMNMFADEFLTQFGFLKSEEKHFHALEMSEKFGQLLEDITNTNIIPGSVKDKVLNYIKLRHDTSTDQKFKLNSQLLLKCLTSV